MILLPAIDLFDGKAVRLYKGDYNEMTVYSNDPPAKAMEFCAAGAEHIHLVDLEGAKAGRPVNASVIESIISRSGLHTEVGGGIRDEDAVKLYLDMGAERVILGTAALRDPDFLARMASRYGAKIAVGVDARDGKVAVSGWLETSDTDCFDFIANIADMGIKTVICTDISRDGAMRGTNLPLYRELTGRFGLNIIASGGVSSMSDVLSLNETGVFGAILGRAIYTGGIDLKTALEAIR